MQRQRAAGDRIDLGAFEEVLRELDGWASGTAPQPAARRRRQAADPRADAGAAAREAIPAGARVLGLERGLYALALRPAEAGLAAIGVHVEAVPGQPPGAVVVIAAAGRSGWLCALHDRLIVKVRAPSGRVIVTRYGAGFAPAVAAVEVVPLDFRTPGRSQAR